MSFTWPQILEHWPLIEADLQDAGIDVYTGILERRPSRWLQARITGLLWTGDALALPGAALQFGGSRLARALRPREGS